MINRNSIASTKSFRMISLLILILIGLLSSSVLAQTSRVYINSISNSYPDGLLSDTKILAGSNHTIEMWWDGTGIPSNALLSTNAWIIHGSADWQSVTSERVGMLLRQFIEGGTLSFSVSPQHMGWHKVGGSGDPNFGNPGVATKEDINNFTDNTAGPHAGNSTGTDTVAVLIALTSAGPGWDPITNPVGATLTISFSSVLADHGKNICIDSITNPIGSWEWAPIGQPSISPEWDNGLGSNATRCWEVFDPNQPTETNLLISPDTLDFFGTAGDPAPIVPQSFSVTAEDGSALAFTTTENSAWILRSPQTGNTPANVAVTVMQAGLAVGTHFDSIQVAAPGAANTPYVYVRLTLAQGNQAPVLDPIGAQSGPENSLLTFGTTATDADGTIPTMTTTGLPTGATYTDNLNGTGTFNWTPLFTDAGVYNVTFLASDGTDSDSEIVAITVNDVNRQPVLDPIGGQIVAEQANLNFTITASDPDGTTPTLAGTPLPTGATFSGGVFDWTPNNTQSGFYDVLFTASDGLLIDSELVTIEVTDIDGFVVAPDTLFFSAVVGDPNPSGQNVNISVSDGSIVPFVLNKTATWITTSIAGGDTPLDVMVNVDLASLAVGTHFDSIDVSMGGGTEKPGLIPQVNSSWIYVNLNYTEPAKLLVVSPDTAHIMVFEDLPSLTAFINVSEIAGDSIDYIAVSNSSRIQLVDSVGFTPGTFKAMISPSALGVGVYFDSITISSSVAANSPLYAYMSYEIKPCPVLNPVLTTYNRIAFEGETVTIDDTLQLTSTAAADLFELEWTTTNENNFNFDSNTGTTPSSLALNYSRTFATQGVYADTTRILSAVSQLLGICPRQSVIIINTTVNRAPSADTVFVINAPAVPGMKVVVPVEITNSCQLSDLHLGMSWNSGDMHLDSITFNGTVVDYLNNKVVDIDNSLMQFGITLHAGAQPLIPIGSQQQVAKLHFALTCEILDGIYPISLTDPDTSIYFTRDCGVGSETEIPEYVPGNIIVGSASNFVCGYVVDPSGVEIPGATVELFEQFPTLGPLNSTTSSGIGSFAFDSIMVIPFDLYAYKDGYYPGRLDDLNYGDKGVIIVLTPLPEILTETSEWVDYFCQDSSSTFLGDPLQVGAVVEAHTQSGLLVAQKMVSTVGKYGFMPVYRGNSSTGDIGAATGDNISFSVNGLSATATGNTTYPAAYAQVSVCLEVRGEITKDCPLQEGWNLISWNVNTPTDDLVQLLNPYMDCIDVILGFEGGGLTFDPDLRDFSTLWYMDHLSGYWIKVKTGCQVTLSITGLPVPVDYPIPVSTNWNLISYLPEIVMAPDYALNTIHDNLLYAYGWNGQIELYQPGATEFNTLTQMDVCNGYWVKMSAADVLQYPTLPAGSTSAYTGILYNENPQSLKKAATGGVVTTPTWLDIYSSDLTLDNITVSTGSNITAHEAKTGELVGHFEMKESGKFGFMPVYAGAELSLKPGGQFYLAIDDVETSERFDWTGNGDRIAISALSAGSSSANLPTDYSLAQNYPNPFNPSTSISFSLPVAGKVRIEIYNILGALVATPYDDIAQAGKNTVIWDGLSDNGEQVASGVYLYRMSADNYSETRKMMLLK